MEDIGRLEGNENVIVLYLNFHPNGSAEATEAVDWWLLITMVQLSEWVEDIFLDQLSGATTP